MAFDLYQDEAAERVSTMQPVMRVEPGAFHNFLAGTGKMTMRGFASAGRAIDMLGAVGPIVQDAFSGGTEAQDRYFREHDEVYGRAVDYWTPAPGEVGTAGQVAGQLLSMLPTVIAAPGLTSGLLQLQVAEDLMGKGVSEGKARAAGAVQSAGLALGVWMPILGQNLWQRVVVGGAGFNVAQGAVTRGVSGTILEGTAAADDFKAFDWEAVTLDALLGLAFGGMAHLSPAQRAQGAKAWERIADWTATLKGEGTDSIVALRQAQHLNVDSAPGRPADALALNAHVVAMRQAIEDLMSGRPVEVSQIVDGVNFLPDEGRAAFQRQMADELATQVRTLLEEEIALTAARAEAEATPGFMRTAEQKLALLDPAERDLHPEVRRAIEIAKKPGFERTAAERIFLDSMLSGGAPEWMLGAKAEPAVRPEAQPTAPAQGDRPAADPIATEAQRIVADNPDLPITLGKNADGTSITTTAKQFLADTEADVLRAQEDAKLFETAAACMLGVN